MRRWTIVVARLGGVFVAVGLALLLVSFIPSVTSSIGSSDGFTLPQSSFLIGFSFSGNSQTGMRISANTTEPLTIYVIRADYTYIYNWFHDNIPDKPYPMNEDVSMLNAFLGNNSNLVAYQTSFDVQTQFDYAPSDVENDTLILANFGSAAAIFSYEVSRIDLFASSAKMQMIAVVAIPLGLLLSVPWLISRRAEKKPQTVI
jgi:hypothetical protein